MYDKILRQLQDLVRARRYVVTIHAADEMEADGLTLFDVESGVLGGTIVARQRDRDSREWKYVIHGETVDRADVAIVVKVSTTAKAVIITVYRED